MECPLCLKVLPNTVIENHVSKCLFLNEPAHENGGIQKRPSCSKENTNLAVKKKAKYNFHNSSFENVYTQQKSQLTKLNLGLENVVTFL